MVCQKYAMIFLTDMNTIANKILARAKRHGAGWVFSAKHLTDLGDRAAIDQALSRLAKDGGIRRLARGLYDWPRIHPVLGPLSPNLDAVAAAAAEQAGHRLQISPARAANVFGLSSQVPAKAVYLTDGSSRRIKIGNQVVYLKHAGPRALLGAGTRPVPHFRPCEPHVDLFSFPLQLRRLLDAPISLAVAMAWSALRFHPAPCDILRTPRLESELHPPLALAREHPRT